MAGLGGLEGNTISLKLAPEGLRMMGLEMGGGGGGVLGGLRGYFSEEESATQRDGREGGRWGAASGASWRD